MTSHRLRLAHPGALPQEAHTFDPVALDAMDHPPSPLGRIMAATISALVLVGIGWATIGKVDIVAVAPGKIVSHARTKVVQPFEIATVSAILVHPGQSVHAGDPLIELDSVAAYAEQARARADLAAAQLDEIRLAALLADVADPPFDSVDAGVGEIARAKARLAAQRAEAKAKLANIAEERAQRVAERDAAKLTLAKAETVVPIVEERAEIRRKSAALAYGSRLLELEAQQQAVEARAEVSTSRSKISGLDASIEALDQQAASFVAELRKTALGDLSQAREHESAAAEALAKANHRLKLQTLRAPIDGTVQQLNVATVGSVVTPAQQVVSVVPGEAEMEVEAVLENKDIGFVAPGQSVELKIDAYPFTRYGLARGTVTSVDRDAEPAPQRQAREGSQRAADTLAGVEGSETLMYMVHVKIADNAIKVDGKPATLLPGMAVKAEIKTGRRRIIDYLLAPLSEYRHDALRER